MNCLGHKKVVLLTSQLQPTQSLGVFSQVREHGLTSEGGWPSRKLRLTLLISFGGLLALMVIAGLDALRLARQLHTQEEANCLNRGLGICGTGGARRRVAACPLDSRQLDFLWRYFYEIPYDR